MESACIWDATQCHTHKKKNIINKKRPPILTNLGTRVTRAAKEEHHSFCEIDPVWELKTSLKAKTDFVEKNETAAYRIIKKKKNTWPT